MEPETATSNDVEMDNDDSEMIWPPYNSLLIAISEILKDPVGQALSSPSLMKCIMEELQYEPDHNLSHKQELYLCYEKVLIFALIVEYSALWALSIKLPSFDIVTLAKARIMTTNADSSGSSWKTMLAEETVCYICPLALEMLGGDEQLLKHKMCMLVEHAMEIFCGLQVQIIHNTKDGGDTFQLLWHKNKDWVLYTLEDTGGDLLFI